MDAKKKFPDGFLWGSATASYQVEGGIENADWAEAGRLGWVPQAGRACDHFGRFREDFDIAKSLNQNAHRFSIEWARIEPEEGKFDEKAIEHYRDVVAALHERGLTPLVTLWHFTLPLWFSESGGFLRRDADEVFARYCRFVVERLSGATMFITINEPMVYTGQGYLRGVWPPFRRNPLTYLRLVRSLIAAHRAAYKAIHEVRKDARVGIAKNNIYFEAGTILYRPLCVFLDWFRNRWFLNAIRDTQDFIGLNHYYRLKIGASTRERATMLRSDMGWELYPESLYRVLLPLKRHNVPVYVTEHGLADALDTRREAFIRKSLVGVLRAIEEGVPVYGYFHWSLIDNFEWAEGFEKRFGLVVVDYDTLERKVRGSAHAYADICKRNAL